MDGSAELLISGRAGYCRLGIGNGIETGGRMTERSESTPFHKGIQSLLCAGYACEIRYLVHKNISIDRNELLAATITFGWKADKEQKSFHKDVPNLVAGRVRLENQTIDQLWEILDLALKGEVTINGETYSLTEGPVKGLPSVQYPESEWELSTGVLQYRVVPAPSTTLASDPPLDIFTPELDAQLQKGPYAFSGVHDLVECLSLPDPRFRNTSAAIAITIESPADFDMSACHWDEGREDRLLLKVLAHGTFRWNDAKLLLRELPKRAQAPKERFGEWEDHRWGNNLQVAWAPLLYPSAHEVVADLIIGGVVASRRTFPHPQRADNPRYLVMTEYDGGLEKLQEFLFKPSKEAKSKKDKDARKFEQAVAALLFLRGFSPVLPMNTDSVDIVVTTPAGHWLVVECSFSLDDARKKAGKLVRRREALRAELAGSGHRLELVACLVCILPRAQIAIPDDLLRRYQVQLWSEEDVKEELSKVKHPGDSDRQILDMAKSLSAAGSLEMPPIDEEDPFGVLV